MSEPYAVIEVTGRPATFATAHEASWKQAIRDAVAASSLEPRPEACSKVRIDFRTPVPRMANERWDLDNLVKPTLDAMEGIFVFEPGRGCRRPMTTR